MTPADRLLLADFAVPGRSPIRGDAGCCVCGGEDCSRHSGVLAVAGFVHAAMVIVALVIAVITAWALAAARG